MIVGFRDFLLPKRFDRFRTGSCEVSIDSALCLTRRHSFEAFFLSTYTIGIYYIRNYKPSVRAKRNGHLRNLD